MGNNTLCCCKADYYVNNAEIREDNKTRAGRLQNSMKINTEINDFSKLPQFDNNLKVLKDQNMNTFDMSSDCADTELIGKEERKLRLKQLEQSTSKLIIEMTNKNLNIFNQKIFISCTGLKDSLRGEKDGFTYFGCINSEDVKNDYLISLPENEFDDRCLDRHFQIQFKLADFKYYIKDLGKGFGAFMKITEPYQLKTDLLINIGDSYIVVSIGEDDIKSTNEEQNACITDVSQTLTLKIFSGTYKYDPISFNPIDDKIITIGRNNEADIAIDDDLLSRFHCSIKFNSKFNSWILFDGTISFENNENISKPSTNGTWIYMKDDIEIKNNFIFKANQSIFRVSLVNN